MHAGELTEYVHHVVAFAAADGSVAGDWLTSVASVVLGILGIVAAVVVAWRQRVIQLRDRAAERGQEEVRRLEREAHAERIARREMWRAEYEQIRTLLENGEVLAYRVRNDGPFTADGLAALDVATFQMNAERLAARGVEQLRGSLIRLAKVAEDLAQFAVPEEAVVVARYRRGRVTRELNLHRVQRLAIGQDRTAHELAKQVAAAWRVLRVEWGS
jgi:hypothetical protein